jgi:pyrroline-5-carboxylate reductase
MKIDNLLFVGGGRMAEALINGILTAQLAEGGQICAVDPDPRRREILSKQYGISTEENAQKALSEGALVIIAVKPQMVGHVLQELREKLNGSHLLISIAAGVTLAFMEKKLEGSGARVIRVMPNTPALIQEGASALSPGKNVTKIDLDLAFNIFEAVGKAVVMDEGYLDAVTGLSGSGPAYVFSFLEALIDAGVKVGLVRTDAETLVLQTVLGAVKLAMAGNDHPAQLRAMVTSPGGTTIAGLHEMERAGFQGIIMDAVEAATNRSKELGKEK